MPVISGSDTISFYSQHDLEYISDSGSFETYALVSNGEDEHPVTYALIFSVNKQKLSHQNCKQDIPRRKSLFDGSGQL